MRPDRNNEESYNDYDQIRERLVPYVKEMGYTHVEFMPVMVSPGRCGGAVGRYSDPTEERGESRWSTRTTHLKCGGSAHDA